MSNPLRWASWPDEWPRTIFSGAAKTFQPMNVNFGLFPPIDAKGGRKGRKDRYKAYTDRAKQAFTEWLAV